MLVVVVMLLSFPAEPFGPTTPTAPAYAADDCLGGPLTLRMTDYLRMGNVMDTWASQGCSRLVGNAERPPFFGNYVIGTTRIGRFNLFGEQLGWGVNVVTRPGTRIGEPDQMYAVPALDLPEPWQRAIDKATVPALAVGGAVVLTSVLLGILGK